MEIQQCKVKSTFPARIAPFSVLEPLPFFYVHIDFEVIWTFLQGATWILNPSGLWNAPEPPKFTKIRYVGKKNFTEKSFFSKKKKKKVSLCFTERSCCFTDDSNERSLIRTLVYTCSARFRASYTTFSLRLSSPFRYK